MKVGPIQIGKFELSLVTVPVGSAPPYKDEVHVWIHHADGEGMSTKVANLERLIEQFYADNF